MPMQKESAPDSRSKPKHSLRTTLFLETLFLLGITVMFTGVASFFVAKQELTQRTVSSLESAVFARESFFESKIAREKAQLSILAKDPSLARLPSVTNLVGFQTLLKISAEGDIQMIAGTKTSVDEATLRQLSKESAANFLPIFSRYGWNAYLIAAPQTNTEGVRTGTLVAVFDPQELINRLFETEYMSASAEVLLATIQNGELVMLHTSDDGKAVQIRTNDEKQRVQIARALAVTQGIEETIDYSGIPVLSAYRTMPSIGWTVIVQMDRYEVTAPILRLAVYVTGIGLLLICLLSLSMFALSRRITEPLVALAKKLQELETRRWLFSRSIFTGNELETVDIAATDLTGRLRESYDHLEELVQQRTEAVRKENARNKAILENIEYGLVMTDANGVIVYANRAAELLAKKNAGGLLQKHVTEALPVLDAKNQELRQDQYPVMQVLRERKSFSPSIDPELSLRQESGTVTSLYVRAAPILEKNKCLGVVAVLRDTTEERRIDKVKSEFIALVSHQLRTPLSSMRWYLEMLLDKEVSPLPPEQHQYVEEISTSNIRMVHLVNALLNVSRLELGTMKVETATVMLEELLDESIGFFKQELKQKKMTIAVEKKTRDPIAISTNKELLQLIIENLISNGIKYGREGTSIAVRIGKDNAAPAILIDVSTQGMGIPEGEQREIFTKMFRGTNAKASDTDGSGLGLYISHIAAETIGATLGFVSEEDKGTTFTVSVPVK